MVGYIVMIDYHYLGCELVNADEPMTVYTDWDEADAVARKLDGLGQTGVTFEVEFGYPSA